MDEKEFLTAYCKYVVGNRHKDAERIMNAHSKLIDKFLEEHHKEYYEVEFIKKGNADTDFCYEELERARVADEESYASDPNPELTTEEKNYYLDKENK